MYLKIKLSCNMGLSANTVIISLFFITAPKASEGETAVWGETASSNVFRDL